VASNGDSEPGVEPSSNDDSNDDGDPGSGSLGMQEATDALAEFEISLDDVPRTDAVGSGSFGKGAHTCHSPLPDRKPNFTRFQTPKPVANPRNYI
jgi:hypothetical protein